MGKVPSQYSRDRARSAHFQKGQLTLAPKLRLTDRILGDWPRSFLNPDPLPTWGLVRVGRTPGTASLTPESGVRGHSFAFMEPEPKSRPDPPEMTRGPGWARVEQRSGSSLHHPGCHWAETWRIFLPRWPTSQTLGLLTQTTRVGREIGGLPVV